MDRLFVDTNVMLDLLAHREPFYDSALRLFSLAYQGKCEIVVASLSYATCAYVLGKCVKPEKTKGDIKGFLYHSGNLSYRRDCYKREY